jgi:CO/xanthine dehydrogenase FAD-binding subunit
MRSNVRDYELKAPGSLSELLNILESEPFEWTLFAGGTDIMVLLEAGKLRDRKFLSLWQLDELRGVEVSDDAVTIGSLTTYGALQKNEAVRQWLPLLISAAKETGGLAIQNRGTLGGNIANASPAADSPPALLVYDAQLELISSRGSLWVPYDGFHTGYKQMTMAKDEMIGRIRIPKPAGDAVQYYKKVGTRRAQAISKVVIAAYGVVNDRVVETVRVAVGSVAPITLRCHKTEGLLRGQRLTAELIAEAVDMFSNEICPIDDIRSTARYRRRVACNLFKDFLRAL